MANSRQFLIGSAIVVAGLVATYQVYKKSQESPRRRKSTFSVGKWIGTDHCDLSHPRYALINGTAGGLLGASTIVVVFQLKL